MSFSDSPATLKRTTKLLLGPLYETSGPGSGPYVQGLLLRWLHDEQPNDPGAYGSLAIGGSPVLKVPWAPTFGISRPRSPTAGDVEALAGHACFVALNGCLTLYFLLLKC